MAFGGPRSSCVRPGAHSARRQDSRNDWTPYRMAEPSVSAGAHAPHSDETHDPTPSRGASYSARRLCSLAFLCSAGAETSAGRYPRRLRWSELLHRHYDGRVYARGHHHRRWSGQRQPRSLYLGQTVLGNVKNAIQGTYHSISDRHAPRYLAEFGSRFNRRFGLLAMIPRLGYLAARTPPMPERLFRLAEPSG